MVHVFREFPEFRLFWWKLSQMADHMGTGIIEFEVTEIILLM